MKKSYSQQGFTLLELSIALVIIGLIAGGVLVGRDLITSARVVKTISQLQQFETAALAFKIKYRCLPGDCERAVALGFDEELENHDVIGGNGNGDGIIAQPQIVLTPTGDLDADGNPIVRNDYPSRNEGYYFWIHLANAGFISLDRPPRRFFNNPATKLGHGHWVAIGNAQGKNSFRIGEVYNEWQKRPDIPEHDREHIPQKADGTSYCGPELFCYSLSPVEAFAMDAKIDDGEPQVYFAPTARLRDLDRTFIGDMAQPATLGKVNMVPSFSWPGQFWVVETDPNAAIPISPPGVTDRSDACLNNIGTAATPILTYNVNSSAINLCLPEFIASF